MVIKLSTQQHVTRCASLLCSRTSQLALQCPVCASFLTRVTDSRIDKSLRESLPTTNAKGASGSMTRRISTGRFEVSCFDSGLEVGTMDREPCDLLSAQSGGLFSFRRATCKEQGGGLSVNTTFPTAVHLRCRGSRSPLGSFPFL